MLRLAGESFIRDFHTLSPVSFGTKNASATIIVAMGHHPHVVADGGRA